MGISCNDATAYITHYPCLNCTRLLLASGIKTINITSKYRATKITIASNEKMKLKICNPKLCFSLSLIYLNILISE